MATTYQEPTSQRAQTLSSVVFSVWCYLCFSFCEGMVTFCLISVGVPVLALDTATFYEGYYNLL